MSLRIVAAVHDPPIWSLPQAEVARIAAALPDDLVAEARMPADRQRLFPDADVILANRMSSAEVRSAPRLRWIQATAVGVGGLPLGELAGSPVVVTNARGVHSAAIAEHAIALVLALRRNLHLARSRQAERTWAQVELQMSRGPALTASRMLIIGLGGIGSAVARLASGLGFVVTGLRRHVELPMPPGVDTVVGPGALLDELATSDAVVLAAPTTPDTRAMIGERELSVMRRSAVLVNVARGKLLDEDALVHSLQQGRIAGAGLDAFVREPLPDDHPFWRLPNVLITPHTASFGADYWAPAVDLFLENVARFKRGDPLVNVVDKLKGY